MEPAICALTNPAKLWVILTDVLTEEKNKSMEELGNIKLNVGVYERIKIYCPVR